MVWAERVDRERDGDELFPEEYPADREIAHLSEEVGAGLIVMRSRGLGGVRRALMGSVSDSVVRHAHCPVFVARTDEER
jgi:nucleotide-binding universal stress UspA family protein